MTRRNMTNEDSAIALALDGATENLYASAHRRDADITRYFARNEHARTVAERQEMLATIGLE